MTRRLLVVATAVATLAAGCGAGDTEAETTRPITAADPPPTETTSTAGPEPTEAEAAPDPTEPEDDEAAEDGDEPDQGAEAPTTPPPGAPAHTIPILTEHLFPETVYGLDAVAGYLVVATGTGVIRLDVDTGEQVRIDVPMPEDRRAEPLALTGGAEHVLIAADRTREVALDLIVSIDVGTMEERGRLVEPGGAAPLDAGAADGIAILNVFDQGWSVVDEGALVDLDIDLGLETGGSVLTTEGEVWYLHEDGFGGIVDVETGEARATFDSGLDTSFVFSDWEIVTADGLWIDEHLDGTLHRLDRDSLEITTSVAFDDRYPDAVVDLIEGRPRDTLVELAVVQDDVQWLVVLEVDPTTGDVLWDHVFSQFGTSEGFSVAERGNFTVELDGRIFVQDSARRIVEVDRSQLGTATGPWASPGLGLTADLDPEQEAVMATLRTFLADYEAVEVIGQEAMDEALGRGFPVPVDMETWTPRYVTIIDDRAFTRITPGPDSDEIGVPFTLVRSGDGWAIDGRLLCHVLSFTAPMSERCEA